MGCNKANQISVPVLEDGPGADRLAGLPRQHGRGSPAAEQAHA